MKTKVIALLCALFMVSACSKDVPETPVEPPKPEVPVVLDVIPFTLVGVDYTLPVAYQTLIDDGWEAVDDVEGTLEAHTLQEDVYMRKDTNLIIVSLHNNTDEQIEKEASMVAQIAAENRTSVNMQDQPVDIQIFNGIDFDTDEDTIAKDFEMMETGENQVYRILTIQHNKLMKTEIKYKHDTGDMRWIIIQNFK